MNRVVRRSSFLLFLVFVLIFLLTIVSGWLFGGSSIYADLLGLLSVGMMLWVTYCFRYNTSLFICFFMVLYSIYSIFVAVYLFPEIRPDSLYSQIQDNTIYCTGIQCIFLFSLTVIFFVLNGVINKTIQFANKPTGDRQLPYNPIIIAACIIVIILITSTNVSFGGMNKRITVTALYEYKTVFFAIGMMYSGNRKAIKILWLVLVIIWGGISAYGGNRAEILPLFITYIYFYHNSIKPKYAVIGVLAGTVLMISIGAFRQMIFRGGFDFQIVWEKIINEKLTFDTAYFAYVPSVESIAVSGKISLAEKFRTLVGNIVYLFLGGQSDCAKYALETYTARYYRHTGGYVSLTYFFFWFGLFGAVLFGILVCFYVRMFSRNEKDHGVKKNACLSMAVSVGFVSTVGRWFMYNPISLIRGELIMLVVAWMAGVFDKLFFKKAE